MKKLLYIRLISVFVLVIFSFSDMAVGMAFALRVPMRTAKYRITAVNGQPLPKWINEVNPYSMDELSELIRKLKDTGKKKRSFAGDNPINTKRFIVTLLSTDPDLVKKVEEVAELGLDTLPTATQELINGFRPSLQQVNAEVEPEPEEDDDTEEIISDADDEDKTPKKYRVISAEESNINKEISDGLTQVMGRRKTITVLNGKLSKDGIAEKSSRNRVEFYADCLRWNRKNNTTDVLIKVIYTTDVEVGDIENIEISMFSENGEEIKSKQLQDNPTYATGTVVFKGVPAGKYYFGYRIVEEVNDEVEIAQPQEVLDEGYKDLSLNHSEYLKEMTKIIYEEFDSQGLLVEMDWANDYRVEVSVYDIGGRNMLSKIVIVSPADPNPKSIRLSENNLLTRGRHPWQARQISGDNISKEDFIAKLKDNVEELLKAIRNTSSFEIFIAEGKKPGNINLAKQINQEKMMLGNIASTIINDEDVKLLKPKVTWTRKHRGLAITITYPLSSFDNKEYLDCEINLTEDFEIRISSFAKYNTGNNQTFSIKEIAAGNIDIIKYVKTSKVEEWADLARKQGKTGQVSTVKGMPEIQMININELKEYLTQLRMIFGNTKIITNLGEDKEVLIEKISQGMMLGIKNPQSIYDELSPGLKQEVDAKIRNTKTDLTVVLQGLSLRPITKLTGQEVQYIAIGLILGIPDAKNIFNRIDNELKKDVLAMQYELNPKTMSDKDRFKYTITDMINRVDVSRLKASEITYDAMLTTASISISDAINNEYTFRITIKRTNALEITWSVVKGNTLIANSKEAITINNKEGLCNTVKTLLTVRLPNIAQEDAGKHKNTLQRQQAVTTEVDEDEGILDEIEAILNAETIMIKTIDKRTQHAACFRKKGDYIFIECSYEPRGISAFNIMVKVSYHNNTPYVLKGIQKINLTSINSGTKTGEFRGMGAVLFRDLKVGVEYKFNVIRTQDASVSQKLPPPNPAMGGAGEYSAGELKKILNLLNGTKPNKLDMAKNNISIAKLAWCLISEETEVVTLAEEIVTKYFADKETKIRAQAEQIKMNYAQRERVISTTVAGPLKLEDIINNIVTDKDLLPFNPQITTKGLDTTITCIDPEDSGYKIEIIITKKPGEKTSGGVGVSGTVFDVIYRTFTPVVTTGPIGLERKSKINISELEEGVKDIFKKAKGALEQEKRSASAKANKPKPVLSRSPVIAGEAEIKEEHPDPILDDLKDVFGKSILKVFSLTDAVLEPIVLKGKLLKLTVNSHYGVNASITLHVNSLGSDIGPLDNIEVTLVTRRNESNQKSIMLNKWGEAAFTDVNQRDTYSFEARRVEKKTEEILTKPRDTESPDTLVTRLKGLHNMLSADFRIPEFDEMRQNSPNNKLSMTLETDDITLDITSDPLYFRGFANSSNVLVSISPYLWREYQIEITIISEDGREKQIKRVNDRGNVKFETMSNNKKYHLEITKVIDPDENDITSKVTGEEAKPFDTLVKAVNDFCRENSLKVTTEDLSQGKDVVIYIYDPKAPRDKDKAFRFSTEVDKNRLNFVDPSGAFSQEDLKLQIKQIEVGGFGVLYNINSFRRWREALNKAKEQNLSKLSQADQQFVDDLIYILNMPKTRISIKEEGETNRSGNVIEARNNASVTINLFMGSIFITITDSKNNNRDFGFLKGFNIRLMAENNSLEDKKIYTGKYASEVEFHNLKPGMYRFKLVPAQGSGVNNASRTGL